MPVTSSPFNRPFKTCDGLNVRTLLSLIVILAPVCGFLPVLAFFSRTKKFPNPEILTFSPEHNTSFKEPKINSTSSEASFLEKPIFS